MIELIMKEQVTRIMLKMANACRPKDCKDNRNDDASTVSCIQHAIV